jgi:hypothetical protein
MDSIPVILLYDRTVSLDFGVIGCRGPGFFVRQASEQYLTSSQFFAQRLRQTISRPHAKQILRGSAALLPLKSIAAKAA